MKTNKIVALTQKYSSYYLLFGTLLTKKSLSTAGIYVSDMHVHD